MSASEPPRVSPSAGVLLEHRRIAGLVALLGPGLLGLLLWVLALGLGMHVLLVPAGLALLVSWVLFALGRRLARRAGHGSRGEAPGRITALLTTLTGLTLVVIWENLGAGFTAPLTPNQAPVAWLGPAFAGSVGLVCALSFALLARFYATTRSDVLPEARGVAAWMRLLFWMCALAGLSLIFDGRYPAYDAVLPHLQHLVLILLGLELFLLALLARRRGRFVVADPLCLRLLFGRFDPISSLFAFLTEAFGIDLRGSWALAFIRRSLGPVAGILLLLGWGATAFTMVGPSERGVLEIFGVRDGDPLGPGLHVGWPWPIQRVLRVDVDRVRSLPIGFQGAKPGASLLWTARHAEEEYNLLLGDGHDLVSVNANLHYRVRDVFAYLYGSANPDVALSSVADRVLMRETVGRSLDGVLSENLSLLAQLIQGHIQEESERLGLGFDIVDLTLLGLHPPVMVARDYQSVVGAGIEREIRILEAQAYREEVLPGAQAQALTDVRQARAEKVSRVAGAKGESAAFTAIEESYRAAPELFMFRRRLEAREAQLAGRPFVVVDDRFERDGGAIWVSGQQQAPEQEDF